MSDKVYFVNTADLNQFLYNYCKNGNGLLYSGTGPLTLLRSSQLMPSGKTLLEIYGLYNRVSSTTGFFVGKKEEYYHTLTISATSDKNKVGYKIILEKKKDYLDEQ